MNNESATIINGEGKADKNTQTYDRDIAENLESALKQFSTIYQELEEE